MLVDFVLAMICCYKLLVLLSNYPWVSFSLRVSLIVDIAYYDIFLVIPLSLGSGARPVSIKWTS